MNETYVFFNEFVLQYVLVVIHRKCIVVDVIKTWKLGYEDH